MVLAAGVVIYGAMGGAALLWLWFRDRLDALGELSIGEHGVLAGSALGLVVGVIGAFVVDRISRRFQSFEELTSTAQRLA